MVHIHFYTCCATYINDMCDWLEEVFCFSNFNIRYYWTLQFSPNFLFSFPLAESPHTAPKVPERKKRERKKRTNQLLAPGHGIGK